MCKPFILSYQMHKAGKMRKAIPTSLAVYIRIQKLSIKCAMTHGTGNISSTLISIYNQ